MTTSARKVPDQGLHIDFLSHKAAKHACVLWHYSGTVPVGKTFKLGVWEDGKFIGCLIFTPGSCGVGYIGRGLGIRGTHVCELQRVALGKHQAPVSRIVAIGIRILRRAFPQMRLIVSYADPAEGHHGGIYQAGGWLYVGQTAAAPMWRDKQGRLWHDRSCTPNGFCRHKGKLSRCAKQSDCERVERPPKHRYFYPLDDEIRELVAGRVLPYPKRAMATLAQRVRVESH
jgi:hypothetical protein